MSSRFDRRPGRPSRGGDSAGGRPSRGGTRGRRPRVDGSPTGSRRREADDSRTDTPWRGSRDGEFRGRGPSRNGAFRGGPREASRPAGRGDRREGDRRFEQRRPDDRRFEDRRQGDRRFENRRSDDRRFSERRFDDRRDGDRREGDRHDRDRRDGNRRLRDRRFEDRRETDQRFKGSRSQDRRLTDRRPGGRPFSDGDSRSLRPGRAEHHDRQQVAEQIRGEAAPHGADPVADDLLWGRHATQAALEAGRPIHRIWCTSEMRSAPKFMQLLRDAKASGVLVEEVTWARLAQMTGGAVHQGIALQTAAADTLNLPDLIDGCSELNEPPLLLALDGLTDPHNLGAIVRSAEALGAHGVVLPQRRSAGLTGSVAKVAAGALEHLPVARVVNLNRSLETLKDAGYRVVGLAEEGDQTLEEVDLEGPLVVVTGSEGQGLSMLTRRHCDQLIRIPLRGVTPSLNASVATALCLYEVARRGWMKGLQGQNPSPRIVRPQISPPPSPPLEPLEVSQNGAPAGSSAEASPAEPSTAVASPAETSSVEASDTTGIQPSGESDASHSLPEQPGIDLQIERLAQTAEPRFEGSVDL
ncbi:23S rRNA (guanosine-2'-O-)-methyltransferase RlmB [Synechococcus sp. MIT S9509]|uniref:23S rRNA (guanosine(2251)-2'-O)-methyltransferase RlmB n=1 Tax=unclassified Synechococcus TaxID=2626047 RepID=UPI0007BB5251|nr:MULTISPECIES: 23S rRNA (guanosine(2251)-2'-O)-methyltransferase RlmB [unclassified Synechococcus]KZR87371.1 23S rRNA (guanosine-2'-O-)-methyltransferase RlmB [Synechococcus sp. MIT S9504]KZR92773.1 23S rRNA (guanosine-2'-O-)-methyltransferase RlmB [Synechococcus sp. MIT S9509]